jgi:D-alanine-D-alanine ligase
MNIAVVFNKPTKRAIGSPYVDTEDDTADSAAEVTEALQSKGADVQLHSVDEHHISDITKIRADCIFNLIEWTGLDMPLSDRAFGLIESLHLPTTGATRENFMMTSDKIPMKKVLDVNHLPTARWQVFENGEEEILRDFQYPVIVKLSLEHCSIGLTHDAIVHDARMLRIRARERIQHFRQPVLAEEFIEGREFQVTAIETNDGLCVLPPAEIVYKTPGPESLLTYESRWVEGSMDYLGSHVTLAKVDGRLGNSIKEITARTFHMLGFRDYMRLDIRIRGNTIFILESNSNPGLCDSDEYGMTVSYKAAGMTFADFVWAIVESALRRKNFTRLNGKLREV